MTSWVTWVVFVVVTVVLGVTASYFSVRAVRWVSAVTTVALLIVVTAYGLNSARSLGMPPQGPPDLQAAFAKGADAIAGALLRPLWPGHAVPEPGRVGWAILIALVLLGYRQLEAWAYARQAPVLDTSQLSEGQPSIPVGQAPRTSSPAGTSTASGTTASGTSRASGTTASGTSRASGTTTTAETGTADDSGTVLTDAQRHDQLAAELKFRLAAMEIRSPSILPGGSRSNGLASIAEDTGVTGADLAGAIIRFFGLLWPGPRRWMLRVWVESQRPGELAADTRVTVELDDPRTGDTVATKTITAASVDEAASMVAGYVTRQVFAWDPTAPPWCYGAADGHDLGAMLIARQERVYADSWEAVRASRLRQIRVLQTVTSGNRCAGLVRYELASLHDLGTRHLTALRLHAMNREQYPRFFRGRYRLCMSLEMAANHGLTVSNKEGARYTIGEVLATLSRCGLRVPAVAEDIVESKDRPGHYRLSDDLSLELLRVALSEVRIIKRQLTLPAVLWAAFRHREERTVWRPHRRLRVRQPFRDGVCVAELLVAVRMLLNSAVVPSPMPLSAYRQALRITAAIAGDVAPIEALFRRPGQRAGAPGAADGATAATATRIAGTAVAAPAAGPGRVAARGAGAWPTARDRVRLLPWLRQTASWQAAYNAACIYSALAQQGLASDDLVVTCLQRAIDNRDSEMERAYDWIAYDPDFLPLKNSPRDEFRAFKKFLRDQNRHDYPRRQRLAPGSDDDDEADASLGSAASPRCPATDDGHGSRKTSASHLSDGVFYGTLRQMSPLDVEAVLAVGAAEKARIVPVDDFVKKDLYPGYKQEFGSQPFVAGPVRPFSAADNARYWLRDSLHFSEGMVPASIAFLDDAQTWGAQLGAEIVGVPPTRGSVNRLAGTHVYIGTIDVDTPWQVQARAARFGAYVTPILRDFGSYWAGRAGELQAAYDYLDRLDLAALDIGELWTAVKDAYAFHRRAWFIHFEVMYVLTANYLAFYSLAEEIGLEGSAVSAFLAGEQTFYGRTDEELWRLAGLARDLGVDSPLRRAAPADALAQMKTLPNGPAWLSHLDAFLATYGQRTEETCRIDTPSWIEDPSPALYAIGSFLAKPAGFDFGVARQASLAERDARIEAARRQLSGQDLRRFNEALASNQAANFAWWNEEHNYLIDRRAAIPARRAVLELGARLAADDVIDAPDDLFYLFKSEFFDVMENPGGASGGSASGGSASRGSASGGSASRGSAKWSELTAMIPDRRAYFEHWKTRGPELPTMLGTIPDTVPDPIMIEVFGLSGHFLETLRSAAGDAATATEIRGFPAAKGVVEGTAKVILSVADIAMVEPGDILVCGGTTTEWTPVFGIITGCVCDTGGSLTHAAIVSREYGIPCVVGTAIATQVIKTGDRIRVDGRAGTIHVFR